MSIAEQARREGFETILLTDGETLTLVRNNQRIGGLLNTNPLDTPAELLLGDDPREMASFEVLRGPVSTAVKSQDQLADGSGNAWTVVRRDDNPSTFTTKFWLSKSVPGLDG